MCTKTRQHYTWPKYGNASIVQHFQLSDIALHVSCLSMEGDLLIKRFDLHEVQNIQEEETQTHRSAQPTQLPPPYA